MSIRRYGKIKIPHSACPSCGYDLGIAVPDGSKYGSIIQACPKCGKRYVDKAYREIAVDGFLDSDKKSEPDTYLAWVCLGIGVAAFCLMFLLIKTTGSLHYIFPTVGVLAFYGSHFEFKRNRKIASGERKEELEELERESRQRLLNPAYASTLARLGYAVPDEYLRTTTKN